MKQKINIGTLFFIMFFLTVSCCKDDSINFSDAIGTETYTDPRDDQEYRIVTIGNQTWFAENLIYSMQKCDGYEIYGSFYYYDDIDVIAPDGWHVPTTKDVLELIEYLGGDSIAGGKLKETDTDHWVSPNKNATNSSGFTALPGGAYDEVPACVYRGEAAYFWINESNSHIFLKLNYLSEKVFIVDRIDFRAGSVRLIKD